MIVFVHPERFGGMMAKLALVYGMRLFPADELAEVKEAAVVLRSGQSARITLHLLEGSVTEIRRQLDESVAAFFEFFPEI